MQFVKCISCGSNVPIVWRPLKSLDLTFILTLVCCHSQPEVKKDLFTSKFPCRLFLLTLQTTPVQLHVNSAPKYIVSNNIFQSSLLLISQQHLTSPPTFFFPRLFFLSLSFLRSEFPAGLSPQIWPFNVRVSQDQ